MAMLIDDEGLMSNVLHFDDRADIGTCESTRGTSLACYSFADKGTYLALQVQNAESFEGNRRRAR
jgi:hypothetical protein